jgi:hypothetical protein
LRCAATQSRQIPNEQHGDLKDWSRGKMSARLGAALTRHLPEMQHMQRRYFSIDSVFGYPKEFHLDASRVSL